jgi:hypothetical protein
MNKKGQIGKVLMIIALVVVVLFVVGFVGQAMSLWNYKFWQPKIEDAKRNVWEQTSSRINGATQTIAKANLEYSRSDNDIEKKAICASLRMSYPDITPEEIDDQTLSRFFSRCKYGVS